MISTCTLMLLAGRIAEQELGAAIYPIEVIQAPVFLDELQVSSLIFLKRQGIYNMKEGILKYQG